MKANELMIGDLLLHKGQPIKVEEILIDGINPMWDGTENYGNEAYYEDLLPIPLTPEILDKNGFKEVDMNDFRLFRDKEYDCAGIRISFMSKGICLWKGDSIGISCKISGCCHYGIPAYVHLLQHAMRLCGIEKEIVL